MSLWDRCCLTYHGNYQASYPEVRLKGTFLLKLILYSLGEMEMQIKVWAEINWILNPLWIGHRWHYC